MYRRLAEIARQYLKKGGLVYIEGKIQSRKYTGKDGIERTAYEIIANEMKMLGGKNESGAAQSDIPPPEGNPRHRPRPWTILMTISRFRLTETLAKPKETG